MRNWIQKKLQGYRVRLNTPEAAAPLKISTPKRIAVAGAGLAGLSAATVLADRGFEVYLYEKNPYLGGKMGAWTFESHGETLKAEHGFHAVFRHYFNLRALMDRIGILGHLVPVDDYLILHRDGTSQTFRGLERTPLLNVWAMRKTGTYRLRDLLFHPGLVRLLALFRFADPQTFETYDDLPFDQFMKKTGVPRAMALVFSSFSRAFFASPDRMSTAELMKSFHSYFLSHDHGLIYDFPDDDFGTTFLGPWEAYLRDRGVSVRLGTPVGSVEKTDTGFMVNGETFDAVVLATDPAHLPGLVSSSRTLSQAPTLARQTGGLKTSTGYAVYRLWTDRFETGNLPQFIITEKAQVLDSVTFYHRVEKESRAWSEAHHGGIFELHCYAVPPGLTDDQTVKDLFLEEFYHYFPDLRGMRIVHEHFQHNTDFPSFGPGLHADRPGVVTEVPGLYLAGDWVKMDNPAMLMEAAATSGILAANEILKGSGLREEPVESVPPKGLWGV